VVYLILIWVVFSWEVAMSKYKVILINFYQENVDIFTDALKKTYKVYQLVDHEHLLDHEQLIDQVLDVDPDIAIIAVNLPDEYGIDLLKELKSDEKTAGIPVLLTALREYQMDEEVGLSYGALDYIKLPLSKTLIKHRVKSSIYYSSKRFEIREEVKRKVNNYEEDFDELLTLIGKLAEFRDYGDNMHIRRLSEYVSIIGRALSIEKDELRQLRQAARLHDIGKVALGDDILLKRGKLTFAEWQAMTEHAVIGKDLIGHTKSRVLSLASTIAHQHHEHYNGEGYPNGLKGSQIALESRIVAICEVFDALICERPFKEAWTYDKIVDYLRKQEGEQFDPQIVQVFLDNLDKIIDVYQKNHTE